MKISIIVALAKGNAIGRNGDLLFHFSDDLRNFKRVTMGHPVIMGRKTFESLPGGALSGRQNIVITRNRNYDAPGITVVDSLQHALDAVKPGDEPFIIGGGEIYRRALPLANVLHLTVIDAAVEDADTFFPEINPEEWVLKSESETMTDPRTQISFRFICMTRR